MGRPVDNDQLEAPSQRLDVAIIADDVTGALDTAAPFASIGVKTRVLLDLEVLPSNIDCETQVLSLNTQSRHLSRVASAETVRLAVAAAIGRRPRILFKKIDSTLRGNIAVEILACMRASGRQHALIAPAVPSQGRSMERGEVFIHGIPLRQTEIAADALSPPPSVPLTEVLTEAPGVVTVHLWPRGGIFLLSDGPGLHAYVPDCKTDADLDLIADFAVRNREKVLLVGASGLGGALARSLGSAGKRVPRVGQPSGKTHTSILFVIGSRTELSACQMTKLREAGVKELRVPASSTQTQLEEVLQREDLTKQVSGILVRPFPTEPRQAAAPHVAQLLGQAALSLIRRLHIDAVVVVGGDTASTVFRALAVREVTLSGELLPGVPTGTMLVSSRPTIFVTKAGGFGNSNSLVRILRLLQNG